MMNSNAIRLKRTSVIQIALNVMVSIIVHTEKMSMVAMRNVLKLLDIVRQHKTAFLYGRCVRELLNVWVSIVCFLVTWK